MYTSWGYFSSSGDEVGVGKQSRYGRSNLWIEPLGCFPELGGGREVLFVWSLCADGKIHSRNPAPHQQAQSFSHYTRLNHMLSFIWQIFYCCRYWGMTWHAGTHPSPGWLHRFSQSSIKDWTVTWTWCVIEISPSLPSPSPPLHSCFPDGALSCNADKWMTLSNASIVFLLLVSLKTFSEFW